MAAAPVLVRDDLDAVPALPGEPAPPTEPPRRSRRTVLLVVVLAVVLLALGVPRVLDLVGGDDAEPEPVAAAPAPATPETRAKAAPTELSALDRVLPELVAFVEKERGLTFKTPVTPVLLDDDAFRARMVADMERFTAEPKTAIEKAARDEVRLTERALKALGLLRPEADVIEDSKAVGGADILGVYDPQTSEMLVRGSEMTPSSKATLVHELTHALDDQHFELYRPELAEGTLEEMDAFRSLVEGNAERIEFAYVEGLSPADRATLDAETEATIEALPDLGHDPIVVSEAFPYFAGHIFVKTLLELTDQKTLDAAFETPPTTTAEILNPVRYLTGISGARLTSPPGDGEAMMSGLFGADDLLALLVPTASETELVETLLAWEGDKVVAWTDGDKTCVRLRLLFSSPGATQRAAGVLARWAATQPDASVEDHATVLVTTCRVVPAQ